MTRYPPPQTKTWYSQHLSPVWEDINRHQTDTLSNPTIWAWKTRMIESRTVRNKEQKKPYLLICKDHIQMQRNFSKDAMFSMTTFTISVPVQNSNLHNNMELRHSTRGGGEEIVFSQKTSMRSVLIGPQSKLYDIFPVFWIKGFFC